MFSELSAMPASMIAARSLLAVACCTEDSTVLQSDCVQAYIQSPLQGPPTYVRLPKAWHPPHWKKYKDPCCRLKLSLYGHPLAGLYWHRYLEEKLVKLRYTKIDGWSSVYFNAETRVGLVIYVDDLLVGGPAKAVKAAMQQIGNVITVEDPHVIDKYLGCFHKLEAVTQPGGIKATAVHFNMTDYIASSCQIFQEKTGHALGKAATPYAPDLPNEQWQEALSKPGVYAPHAASLLMKLLYAARMSRPDIITAVTRLASRVTRWSTDEDRRLKRLYDYCNCNRDLTLHGVLSPADRAGLKIIAWPDADHNGDPLSTKSTSGMFIELATSSSSNAFPLDWATKKQVSTANSTAEAETVSLSACMRAHALPLQVLLEVFLGQPIQIDAREDNQACLASVRAGYSPALRALERTQRVCIGTLHELFVAPPEETKGSTLCTLTYQESATHKGDLFTKAMPPPTFARCLQLINMS
jgi:hypothetical protein